MPAWSCSHCGSENKPRARACELCGHERPAPELRAATTTICPMDGIALTAEGWCPLGGGYPGAMACRVACPMCGGTLGWDGSCGGCYGSRTPLDRATWTKPGDAYEYQRGHWVLVDKGPRSILSDADARAVLRGCLALLQDTGALPGAAKP